MFAQNNLYISFNQKTDIVANHKKTSSVFDVYYNNGKEILTKHYTSPNEMIIISNNLGEVKLYYPQSNEVLFKQMSEMSSKQSLIYYFSHNLTDDLGMSDEGFALTDRRYEENYLVTFWKSSTGQQASNAKVVYEMGNPIYTEYSTSNNKVISKKYYSNYQDFASFRIPTKIIEITYNNTKDSIVNRTLLTNFEVSDISTNDYFNFEIPEDAKPISTK